MKCIQKVSDDFGVGMHQCTRNRIEGSNYCQQHHDLKNPQEFVPVDFTEEPVLEASRVRVTGYVNWETGKGPQVKLQYIRKPIFLERLWIELSSDTERVYLRASGPWVKKDGKPAVSGSDGTLRLSDLPEKTRAKVEIEIEHLRGFLP